MVLNNDKQKIQCRRKNTEIYCQWEFELTAATIQVSTQLPKQPNKKKKSHKIQLYYTCGFVWNYFYLKHILEMTSEITSQVEAIEDAKMKFIKE